ncbi:MAG TPA: hypothetical protein VK717_00590 [Opitutaceae bacterium]|jgi:hypothetical protein|nr:hypothetical protein [Opitutaceae bacterium]
MNQKTSFVISQFTNRSGEIVFRVSGWLDGKRLRKNFSSRAEAERQILEVQQHQGEGGIRTAITRLTDRPTAPGRGVLLPIEGQSTSLLVYLDFALTNYCEPI